MIGVVAYPTHTISGPMQRGPFTIQALPDAPPVSGPLPLIVVSHGTGGSELGHHDSLTSLARAGFIAAAVQHPRDNYRDDSGFGTDLQTIGRAHHIVAFIDALLAHPKIGPLIDRSRIGMAGFSAGGYTTLLTIGGRPNFALRETYERAVPDDPLTRRARAAGDQRRAPGLEIVADKRVRAAFIMAPALGHVFDRAGLADIRVPVRLYRAGADEVLPHPMECRAGARDAAHAARIHGGRGGRPLHLPRPLLRGPRKHGAGNLQRSAGHRPRGLPRPAQCGDGGFLPPHPGGAVARDR